MSPTHVKMRARIDETIRPVDFGITISGVDFPQGDLVVRRLYSMSLDMASMLMDFYPNNETVLRKEEEIEYKFKRKVTPIVASNDLKKYSDFRESLVITSKNKEGLRDANDSLIDVWRVSFEIDKNSLDIIMIIGAPITLKDVIIDFYKQVAKLFPKSEISATGEQRGMLEGVWGVAGLSGEGVYDIHRKSVTDLGFLIFFLRNSWSGPNRLDYLGLMDASDCQTMMKAGY